MPSLAWRFDGPFHAPADAICRVGTTRSAQGRRRRPREGRLGVDTRPTPSDGALPTLRVPLRDRTGERLLPSRPGRRMMGEHQPEAGPALSWRETTYKFGPRSARSTPSRGARKRLGQYAATEVGEGRQGGEREGGEVATHVATLPVAPAHMARTMLHVPISHHIRTRGGRLRRPSRRRGRPSTGSGAPRVALPSTR